ncbi:MAG TPA: hypothetical protein VFA32_07040 [Dehalococcoidia bacterium]|jgi:hypothetical protein|nr:hypothetical protein [Dehalococcoidia bacterium]
MVTTPKPRPRPKEHPDATCLCRKCKAGRSRLRRLGHFAPEPGDYVAPHPNLEAELRELF